MNLAGATLLLLALPPFTYYVWICITDFDGALFLPGILLLLSRIPAPTAASLLLFLSWFFLQVVLQVAAPGKIFYGAPLADGSRLSYKMNGWFSFWCSLAIVGLAVLLGWIPPAIVYDQFGPLLTTVNIFAFAFSLFLYLYGRATGSMEKSSGNLLYDYFMGVSLNPRIGSFDLKFFCESRPGLILWILFNFSLAAKQYQLQDRVTTAMWLVLSFHFLYIADYFFHEEAILSTWDIRHEGFGWMLCWGDLVWVPFTYTLQAHYLVRHPHDLPVWGTVAIVALNMLGYYLFRSSNLQKHKFRANPKTLLWGKPPEYIETAHGTLLLTSGWWGIARHLNYLGDLMMGLAWCLPVLFAHPLPYFYIVYFVILLVHRERRDHIMCLKKYGRAWDEYCRKVPWRIVPGVY